MWREIGYKKQEHLKLTIVGKRLAGDQLITVNPIYNELVVDFFKINDLNFDDFLILTDKYRIDYLESYPSLAMEFLEYLVRHGATMKLKGIMLGSEGITDQQLIDLTNFFRCPIIRWYGQSEKVVLAYSINNGDMFKVFTSYGFPDVIGHPSGCGELIGTTFINKALPLIKYRTGDYGRILSRGDGLWIQEIQGRWGKDFIYLDEKKRIPTTAINIHSAIQSQILFYQLIQNEYGKLHILILPKKGTSKSAEEIAGIVQSEIARKLKGFVVTASIVDSESQIQRSHRGKMIMLVQNLKDIKSDSGNYCNLQ